MTFSFAIFHTLSPCYIREQTLCLFFALSLTLSLFLSLTLSLFFSHSLFLSFSLTHSFSLFFFLSLSIVSCILIYLQRGEHVLKDTRIFFVHMSHNTAIGLTHIAKRKRDDDGRIDTLCSIFKSILKALEMEDRNKCALSLFLFSLFFSLSLSLSIYLSFFFSLVLFRSLFPLSRTRNR